MGISDATLAFLVGLGVCSYFVKLGNSRMIVAKASTKVVDPWNDPAWRKQIIANSRERARASRSSIANESPIPVEIPAGWDDLRERIYQEKKSIDRKEVK
jgi:hypothetical protein